jgi:hypothetical protein
MSSSRLANPKSERLRGAEVKAGTARGGGLGRAAAAASGALVPESAREAARKAV